MSDDLTGDALKAKWGDAIQQKRREAEISQLQLAQQIGCDPQTISRAERGQGSIDVFLTLAHALGVELPAPGVKAS